MCCLCVCVLDNTVIEYQMGIDHKRKSGGKKHQKAMAPLCPASTDRKLCVRSTRQEDVKPCFPALQTWVSRPINRPFRSAVCQLLSPCGPCWWEQLWHNRVLCCPSCRLTQFHLYGHSVERLSQGKEGWWSGFWWTSIAAQVLVVLQNPSSRPTVRFYRARTFLSESTRRDKMVVWEIFCLFVFVLFCRNVLSYVQSVFSMI